MSRRALAAAFACLALAVPDPAEGQDKPVDPAKIQKITEAMPDKPPAQPAKPRKVLVYSRCLGFYHGAIPVANRAFEIMGRKTGAFQAVVSDDLANFEPGKLKEFDAVLFNNSTGELLLQTEARQPRKPDPKKIKDPAQLQKAEEAYQKELAAWEEARKHLPAQKERAKALRQNLLEWVRNGGGLMGIHAASDTGGCDEYNEALGGRFSGHPWHALVPVRNDDPSNPINAAFGGKGFEVTDEIYQFNRGHYSRHKQRVLLSLDRDRMEAGGDDKLKKDGSRKDRDYAVSWVKAFGEGRIFYCSLGHRDEVFWNPAVLQHYLAGLQWVMGDLKGVETAPNPLPASEKP